MIHLTFRGKPWKLIRHRKMPPGDHEKQGYAMMKAKGPGIIGVRAALGGFEELRVLLHEGTHAALWDLDEEAVDETSRDLAEMLWKLGYRKVGPRSSE